MGIDWLSASRDARRTLYRHVRPIVDRHFAGHWSRFYTRVLGQAVSVGQGYEDNFRAGRISRKRAAAIFGWIETNYPAEALAIAATLGIYAPLIAPDWDVFLDQHGRYGQLRLTVLDDAGLAIVAFALRKPVERVPLGQAFCFVLNSAFEGTVLALQAVEGAWYPLPLREGSFTVPIATGAQFLPRDPNTQKPIPLSEDTHLGVHGFAFLAWRDTIDVPPFLVGHPVPLDRLSRLMDSFMAAGEWAVHRLEILFTP